MKQQVFYAALLLVHRDVSFGRVQPSLSVNVITEHWSNCWGRQTSEQTCKRLPNIAASLGFRRSALVPQNPNSSFFIVKVNTWKRYHSVFFIHISSPYWFRRTRFCVDLFEMKMLWGSKIRLWGLRRWCWGSRKRLWLRRVADGGRRGGYGGDVGVRGGGCGSLVS